MSLRIEDYGIIGDTQTAALVGRDGSIDWCCLPRFDSAALFAKLLGTEENGYWRIAPAASPIPGDPDNPPLLATRRRYVGTSLVLESEWDLPGGTLRVTDCMPIRQEHPEIVRVVECPSGEVQVRMDLTIRFEYGSAVPWVRRLDGVLAAIAGPDGVALWSPVHSRGEGMTTVAEWTIREGQRVPFTMTYFRSNEDVPRPVDGAYALQHTAAYWDSWVEMDHVDFSEWSGAVVRSLITLKALTFAPTGGIIAAATTSLPETLGGSRNWDYRYSWLRDATLTLSSLMVAGYSDEAQAWRDWLLRAVAGEPSKLQIMYGPAGERTLLERELPWLTGYEGSAPVRVGNAAAEQFQLDVYGEVLGALHEGRRLGLDSSGPAWDLELEIMDFLESGWKEPDDGIWEVRGPRRHFTHSKVMAWMAVDRAVKDIEEFGLDGPIDRWKALRLEIHRQVCENGYDSERKTFTQYYGSKELDASALMIPLVGFLPATDKRVIGTVEAIQRELTHDGFVMRYDSLNSEAVDGLSGREGAFLACSFWMADDLHLIGRHDEAIGLFERLLSLRNDLGLLSEEYDPVAKRQVGNFPQAFSHVSLVNTAAGLSHTHPDRPGHSMTHAARIAGIRPDPRELSRMQGKGRRHRVAQKAFHHPRGKSSR